MQYQLRHGHYQPWHWLPIYPPQEVVTGPTVATVLAMICCNDQAPADGRQIMEAMCVEITLLRASSHSSARACCVCTNGNQF